MPFSQYISDNSPITNLADLFNLHHGNPLGVAPVWQLVFIFVLIVVMEYFLFQIRRRQKPQYYPALFSLFGVITLCLYYYCFQSGLPEFKDVSHQCTYDQIGWFCNLRLIGKGWGSVGFVCASCAIFILLNALLQILAQMTMYANPDLIKTKPWKEWKTGVGIAMFLIVLTGFGLIIRNPVATTWLFIAGILLMLVFTIIKMIHDVKRDKSLVWGIGTGLVFLIGVTPILMLSLGCAEGTYTFIIVLIVLFTCSKASKKEKKK